MNSYEETVARLYRDLLKDKPAGSFCRFPVIGGTFLKGENTKEVRQFTAKALRARDWFATNGPADAPPLPLSYGDREDLKHGGIDHLVALYARSLETAEYDFVTHPSFHDYACGVHASGLFSWGNEELERRYPAKALDGLDNGLIWRTPEQRPFWPMLPSRPH
jgi:hypothetical protein